MGEMKMVRILIADDDPDTCGFLRRIIKHYFPVVDTQIVQDGGEALEALLELPLALAILDVEMPQMTGLEVARVARRRAIDTAIVLVTAWPTAERARQAARIGVQHFLEKPVIVAEITSVVHRFVNASRWRIVDNQDHREACGVKQILEENTAES